ncbi:MAG: hypothetical protein H5T86_15565, partial [Armatimonadetes bacterium]|nr:hypothetical protein [Armatimonadota bacterium]
MWWAALANALAHAHPGVGPHVHPHPGSGIWAPGIRLLECERTITVQAGGEEATVARMLYLLESKEAAAAFRTISYSYNPELCSDISLSVRLLRRVGS